MGLLNPGDWKASWIGKKEGNDENNPEPEPVPYFRKEFSLNKNVQKARIYISGLGCYNLYLNGSRVGNRVLDPGITDYEEKVLYSTFDVTDCLQSKNSIGVELGRKRYSMITENVWGWHKPPWKDQPKLLLQLEVKFKDGTQKNIVSDDSWKCNSSPPVFDCLYSGEVYDARKEKKGWGKINFNDDNWDNSVIVESPAGELKAQLMEPMRIIDTIKPKNIDKLEKGHYVVDLEKVIAGGVEIEVEGKRGQKIEIKYGEKLNKDGTINLEQDGNFKCSNKLFNQIHQNTCQAILNNFHSIPTDTPVFEKKGWTGDAQLTAEAALYNFNMIKFYLKWMNDFKDAQKENGELAPIIPTSNWGYSETPYGWDEMDEVVPAWDSAYILIPWWVYQFYGDEKILKNHYKEMQKHLDYMVSQADNLIVKDGLGDWLEPTGEEKSREGKPPEEAYLTSTAYFYK